MAEIVVPDTSELILRRLDLDVPTQLNRSAWTGTSKAVGLPGAERWLATVDIGDVATDDSERPWRAFLFALRGPQNWFALPLPCNNVAGNVAVGSGTKLARSIPISGMPVSATHLTAGSFLTITLPSGAFRAVCLMADLVANGSGNGTATFEPELPEVPATGAVVFAAQPFLPARNTVTTAGFSWTQAVAGTTLELEEYR